PSRYVPAVSNTECRLFCGSMTQRLPSGPSSTSMACANSPGPPPLRPTVRMYSPSGPNTRSSCACASSTQIRPPGSTANALILPNRSGPSPSARPMRTSSTTCQASPGSHIGSSVLATTMWPDGSVSTVPAHRAAAPPSDAPQAAVSAAMASANGAAACRRIVGSPQEWVAGAAHLLGLRRARRGCPLPRPRPRPGPLLRLAPSPAGAAVLQHPQVLVRAAQHDVHERARVHVEALPVRHRPVAQVARALDGRVVVRGADVARALTRLVAHAADARLLHACQAEAIDVEDAIVILLALQAQHELDLGDELVEESPALEHFRRDHHHLRRACRHAARPRRIRKIGRASCRERV